MGAPARLLPREAPHGKPESSDRACSSSEMVRDDGWKYAGVLKDSVPSGPLSERD